MRKYLIFLGLLAMNFAIAYSAMAQGFLQGGGNPAPGLFVNPSRFGSGSVQDIMLYILATLLQLSGFFATLFLIIGGYYYVTSAGDDKRVATGKKFMTNSIIGLAIIILSYVILKVVQNTIVSGV